MSYTAVSPLCSHGAFDTANKLRGAGFSVDDLRLVSVRDPKGAPSQENGIFLKSEASDLVIRWVIDSKAIL